MTVVVAGGGITGLAAAYELALAGVAVDLLEASNELGGKVRTAHVDGFLVEDGPNSFIAYRPAAALLARELGIGDQVIGTTNPRRVDIRTRGRFVPLPDGMGLVLPTRMAPFVMTRLFSPLDKLRMAKDLALPRSAPGVDVSIGAFLRRRLGQPLVDRLADPLIGGIYGAPVDDLSLDAVVPQLRAAEQAHRSLLLASLAQGRARRAAQRTAAASVGAAAGGTGKAGETGKAGGTGAAGGAGASGESGTATGGTSTSGRTGSAGGTGGTTGSTGTPTGATSSAFQSLRGGMGTLIDALVARLEHANGVRVRLGTSIAQVEPAPGGVLVRLADGSHMIAEAVVLATPAPASAAALATLAPDASSALAAIPHGSTGVVSLAYRVDQFDAQPDSHGFLVAGDERIAFGACTWSSRKWAGRAPEGFVLARAFLGERGGDLLDLPDGEIAQRIHADLARVAGIHGEPVVRRVARWRDAMPRYSLGHLDRVAAVERAMREHPAVLVTGAALRGVGVPDCIDQGRAAARRAIALVSGAEPAVA